MDSPRAPKLTRRGFLGAAAVTVVAACSDTGAEDETAGSTAATEPVPSEATTGPAATTPPPAGPSRFVVAGPDDSQKVALTFHTDGDLDLATEILGVLGERDVPMTAFVVGEWLDANPDWTTRLTDGGHELANHTYTHPTFSELDPAAMTEEIERCRDVLVRLAGGGGRFFRTSGEADGTRTPSDTVLDLAGQAGYPVVLGFDVDPLDYQDPGIDAVATRTLETVKPGSVISLHFDHPGTVVALPPILDGLDERGLKPVTASELLSVG
ncbi:MAG: polysaccharide deacetylase family protein [Acidimicrobiia bacterium]